MGYVLKPSMMIRCCGMLKLVDFIIENLFDDAMQAATPGNSLISGVVRDWFMKLLENGADPPKPTERAAGAYLKDAVGELLGHNRTVAK